MRLSCELSPGERRKMEGKGPLDTGLLLLQCSESEKEIDLKTLKKNITFCLYPRNNNNTIISVIIVK